MTTMSSPDDPIVGNELSALINKGRKLEGNADSLYGRTTDQMKPGERLLFVFTLGGKQSGRLVESANAFDHLMLIGKRLLPNTVNEHISLHAVQ